MRRSSVNFKEEIRAIVFDFDGTLIDYRYQTTSYTREALARLKDSPYRICLSSGRPCHIAIKAFRKAFGDYPLDYIFGSNGAELMDMKKDRLEILYPLTGEEVRYIGKTVRFEHSVLGIYEKDTFLVSREVTEPSLKEWIAARDLRPVLFDFTKDTAERSKILAIADPSRKQDVARYMSSIDLSMFNTSFSSDICFEIVAKGVDKALSCQKLAQLIGCRMDQILSFGDNDNDLTMLKATTGVLMGNASEQLQPQISLHTSAVTEKGVYDFLERNGLI